MKRDSHDFKPYHITLDEGIVSVTIRRISADVFFDDLFHELSALFNDGYRRFVFEFTEDIWITSNLISVILNLSQLTGQEGEKIAILSPGLKIRMLMEKLDIHEWILFFDDRARLIKHFQA